MVDHAAWRKAQRAPIHCDFPAADTEKSPKIDNGGAHVTVAFDDYVDDLTHVLVGIAANALPENALHLAIVDDSCRGAVLGDGRSLGLGSYRLGHLFCRLGLVRTVQGGAECVRPRKCHEHYPDRGDGWRNTMHKDLPHINGSIQGLKHQSPHYGSVMTGAFFGFVR